jgi:hypothetical protein
LIELSHHLLIRVACASYESLEAFESPGVAPAIDVWDVADAKWAECRTAIEDALFHLAGPPVDEAEGARKRFSLLALRRDVHSGRTSATARLAALAGSLELGVDLVQRWIDTSGARADALQAMAAAIGQAEDRARHALVARLSDPLFHEALRLSGRSLAARAEQLRIRGPSHWRASDRQAAVTVLDYVGRMATKTSPNGVFCATALGVWGEVACAEGSARPTRVLARINIAEATKVAAPLLRDPVFDGAPVALSPALLREEDSWTWWRAASLEDPNALERRARVRSTPLLELLIAHLDSIAEDGSRGVDPVDLIAWTSERAGRNTAAWIERLVTAGLLIEQRGIPHLETRPLRWLALAARAASSRVPEWIPGIEELESSVDEIGLASDSAARVRAYGNVCAAVSQLTVERPLDEDAFVRIDCASPVQLTVPRSVGDEICRVLPRYARLFAALYPPSVRLAPYRSRFLARYRPDEDVVLAGLLHGVFDDLGGFARSSYPDPARISPGVSDDEVRSARETHARFRRFFAERCQSRGGPDQEELELQDEDWEHLTGPTPLPAFSCGLLFQLVPNEPRGVSGSRVIWNGIFGPGLAVSRLAALHPAVSPGELSPLARIALEGWAHLIPPGSVAAEIPYGHSGRTANAGLRTSIFTDEIGLPGETPTPGARTFPTSDLLVRYESSTRRFTLRSRRHGVAVVPVLTSGLSPEGFISFLVAVGQQDAPPLALFPDIDESLLGPIPRIVSGGTVLFRRRWSLAPAEARRIFRGGDRMDRLVQLRRWARTRLLPARVFASTASAPKPRFVHLGSLAFLHVLEELANDGSPLFLREMLPAPEDAWFRDAEGRHAIEFLAHVRGGDAA